MFVRAAATVRGADFIVWSVEGCFPGIAEKPVVGFLDPTSADS